MGFGTIPLSPDDKPDGFILLSMYEKLEAENAELRKERDIYRDLVDHMVHPDIPDQLAAENAKLRELVCHLWYVKPRDVTSVLVNGEMVDLDELMAEVGLRWEDA